jgi:phosphoglucan,water dikinase
VFLPFGCAESALREQGLEPEMRRAVAALDDAIDRGLGDAEVERRRVEAQRVAAEARLPDAVAATVCAAFADGPDADGTRLVVRASADVEDPAGAGGAEIYASVAGVPANNARALAEAVSEVWLSLFSGGAVVLRRAVGAENAGARMAVVVQELLPAELSFHLHTGGALENGLVRSVEENQTGASAGPLPSPVMEAEIVVGSGEALRSRLADGRGGEPWRVEVDQRTGEVRTTRFASVGSARFSDADAPGGWREEAVDYSRRALSSDAEARRRLAARLAAAGAALEAEAGAAQNAEGCVVGEEVWVVQTRPQP